MNVELVIINNRNGEVWNWQLLKISCGTIIAIELKIFAENIFNTFNIF